MIRVEAFPQHKCSDEALLAKQTSRFNEEWLAESDGMRFYWKRLEAWLTEPAGMFATYEAERTRNA